MRISTVTEEVWPSPALRKKIATDFTKAVPMSDFTLSGREAFPEVVAPLYEEINKLYGTDFEPCIKELEPAPSDPDRQ